MSDPQAPSRPVILCLSGNDPSGGAGLAADITAIQAQACHACPIPTAVTVQDTSDVREIHPVDADLIERQFQLVLADTQVSAIKVGICGSAGNARRIANLLAQIPEIPVITDPVVRASGGFELSRQPMLDAMREHLIAVSSVLVPNQDELAALYPGIEDPEDAAAVVFAAGCNWVLLTGGDSGRDPVENLLLGADGTELVSRWPRLNAAFHGSGCTLAASLAAQIGLGLEIPDAVHQAQAYTWNCLDQAFRSGAGRLIPSR